MELVTPKNYKLLDDLNDLLENVGKPRDFFITQVTSCTEIMVLVTIPPFFDSTRKPSKMVFTENLEESEFTTEEIIKNLNEELEEMLKVIKKELLKLIRINEAFTIQEQTKINDNLVDNDIHINIQFDQC
jgi:hypothetical protein